jgi:transcriptional regulator with XRE-family HTH domain
VGKHPKQLERALARKLRREQGMPMKRIAARLGVSVSSVSAWTRDIKLTSEQRDRNLRGPGGPQSPEWIAARVASIIHTSRERRRAYQEEGRARARQRDPLHIAGCMLYWAEGTKSRNQIKLCNSDRNMLVFFRRFLTACFDVAEERFSLSFHVYLGNGRSIQEIEDHWLDALEVPRSCLRKHSINPLPTSSSGRKRNKLPFGVATLSLGDTRIVQHIYGAIQEYAGFEEPRWLDGPPREPAASGRLDRERKRADRLGQPGAKGGGGTRRRRSGAAGAGGSRARP